MHKEKIIASSEVQHYIENNLNILDGYTARDILKLIKTLRMQIVELTPDAYRANKFIINMDHMKAALKERAELKARFQEEPYEEQDFEQRERHHRDILSHNRESLDQSNWQFNVNTALSSASMLVNIVSILISFSSAQEGHDLQRIALRMQQVFHGESMRAQAQFHKQSTEQQQAFHEENRRRQEDHHRESLRAQRAMHNESNSWTSLQAFNLIANVVGIVASFMGQ